MITLSLTDSAFVGTLTPYTVITGSATTLLTNLVAYYQFEEPSSSRYDSSVNGLTLTDVSNNLGRNAAGLLGYCGDAYGITCALRHSNSSSFTLGVGQSFTWQLWVNAQDTSFTSYQAFVSKETAYDGPHGEYGITYDNANHARLLVGNGTASATVVFSGKALNDSNWHHIVAWYDNTLKTANITVDNATPVSASWTGSTYSNNASMSIFNVASSTSYPFTRQLDEIGFWKRTLTSTERTYLYNSRTGSAFSTFATTA